MLLRIAQFLFALGAELDWCHLRAVPIALTPIVALLGFAWMEGAAAPEISRAASNDAWRYLVTCPSCGAQTRVAQRPADGAFVCEKCGGKKSRVTRRGSLSLTPGGW